MVQAVKELIDQGLTITATHYCLTCYQNGDDTFDLGEEIPRDTLDMDFSVDIRKLCFACAIDHRNFYFNHEMVLLVTPKQINQLIKKSEAFEFKVRQEVSRLQLQNSQSMLDHQTLKVMNKIL